ncbi:MAG: T9SS type A sorting domain-containing protein, partial [Cyclobacteriaceae bacterium]
VDIHMLYGKSSITTDQSTTNTWNSNYLSVYRLHDDFNDATVNGNNLTNFGSTDVAAKIVDGQDFESSTSDYIQGVDLAAMEAISQLTLSCWVTPESFVNYGGIVTKYNAFATYLGINSTHLSFEGHNDGLTCGVGNSAYGFTGAAQLSVGTTAHISMVFDGSGVGNANRLKMYVDGANVPLSFFGTIPAVTASNTASFEIGRVFLSAAQAWDGVIDHVSVETTAQNAGWVASQYNSQNQPILTFGTASAGDFYAVAAEEDTYYTSTQNGDWDQSSRWDNTPIPDGQFVNVEIQHNIDIDGNSDDYTVCNCLLTGTGSGNTNLDVSSTRILTVNGDLDADFSGSGGSGSRLQVSNTARVDIEGDMNWDRTNSNTGADLEINLRDDGIINLTGDLSYTISAGDDVEIDMEDDSDFNITGNMLLTADGGDELRIIMDDNSTLDLTGNLTIDQNGGDDVFIHMNNNAGTAAQFSVSGDVSITHDGGDDIEFRTAGASSLIDVTGDLDAVCNGTSDGQDLRFDANDGNININDVSVTRAVDMGEIDFDLDGGDITINSLTANSSGTLFNDGTVTIDIDQASIFTCNNDMDITFTGGDDFRIGLNRNGGSAAQFECGGSLTVNRSGGDDIEFFVYGSSALLHIAMDLSVTSSGGETFNIDIDDNATMDIDGDFTLLHTNGQGGEFDLQAGFSPTLNVDGSFSVTTNGGGNDDYTFDINGGTLQIDTDFTINLNGSTSEDINIQVDGDAVVNVGGDMAATITNADDIDIDLGDNTAGSTAQLNIAGSATYIQNSPTTGQGIEIRIFDDTRYTVGGDLTLTNSVANTDLTLMNLANTGRATIAGDINLNAQSSGDLEIRLDDTSELQIGGDFVRQGSPNMFGELDAAIGATVEYNGNSSQLFAQDAGDGGDSFSYGIVEINNTSGTNPQVTTEGLATVNGGIIFIDGVVASTSTNILVVPDNATATGASDASHVDGPVRKIGNDAFTFPVGDNDNYQAIAISAPSATTDQFEAQYFETDPDPFFSRSMKDASINNLSTVEYWELNRTAGASNVSVTLTWDGNSVVVDPPSLLVAGWDGVMWRDHGNGGTTGTAAAGTVISSGAISTFGPFTLGSSSTLNPLPIELLSFSAKVNGSWVDLFWVTATETNNDFFTIERTRDLAEWEIVTTIPGAGTSIQTLNYQTVDTIPYEGVSYYRLKQTDFDGQFSYSEFVQVVLDGSTTVAAYPNPATNTLIISAGKPFISTQIQLFNSIGKLVTLDSTPITDRKVELHIDELTPGVYYLRIQTEGGLVFKKIIKGR